MSEAVQPMDFSVTTTSLFPLLLKLARVGALSFAYESSLIQACLWGTFVCTARTGVMRAKEMSQDIKNRLAFCNTRATVVAFRSSSSAHTAIVPCRSNGL